MIWLLVRHEWRLLFREPRFWVPFMVPPALLLFSERIFVTSKVSFPEEMGELFLLLLSALSAPMSAPLAADAFAGERERRTLELLQLSPAKASEIFCAKLFAIVPFPIFFAALSQILFFVFEENIACEKFLKALLASVSFSFFFVGISLVISLRAHSVRSATQGIVLLSLPLLFLVQAGQAIYFSSWGVPLLVFFISTIALVIFSMWSFAKFKTL